MLGEYGIPVVFLTADRVAVSRVRENMPWIEAVEIPKRNLFPREIDLVRKRIEAVVEESVVNPLRFKPLVLGRHVMEMGLAEGTVVMESNSAVGTLEAILVKTVFKAYPVPLLPFLLPFYRAWCRFRASGSMKR